MRPATLLCFLATFSFAAVSSALEGRPVEPTSETAQLLVVGVHGLLPKAEAAALEDEWAMALSHGLSLHAPRNLDSPPFQLVRWARRTRGIRPCPKPTSSWDAKAHNTFVSGIGRASYKLRALFDGLADVDLETAMQLPLEKLAEMLPWPSLQEELREYYQAPELQRETRERLKTVLVDAANQGERVMLIAHSMGSMIAYDVLMESSVVVDHFVTVGSPLGTTPVRVMLAREWGERLRVPPGVRRWTNVADRLDIVAADASLANSFLANANGVAPLDKQGSAWLPRGAPANSPPKALHQAARALQRFLSAAGRATTHVDVVRHHSICGHLTTPPMAEALASFLEAPGEG